MTGEPLFTATGTKIPPEERGITYVIQQTRRVDDSGREVDGPKRIHFEEKGTGGESLCGSYRGTPIPRAQMLNQFNSQTEMCSACQKTREASLNNPQARTDGGVGVGQVAQSQGPVGVGAVTQLAGGHVIVDETTNRVDLSLLAAGVGAASLLAAGALAVWLLG